MVAKPEAVHARENVLVTDDDVLRAIDDLKEENERLRRQLEYIAHYEPRNGDRIQAFASVRWYARECLYGGTSPGQRWKKKTTI